MMFGKGQILLGKVSVKKFLEVAVQYMGISSPGRSRWMMFSQPVLDITFCVMNCGGVAAIPDVLYICTLTSCNDSIQSFIFELIATFVYMAGLCDNPLPVSTNLDHLSDAPNCDTQCYA